LLQNFQWTVFGKVSTFEHLQGGKRWWTYSLSTAIVLVGLKVDGFWKRKFLGFGMLQSKKQLL